MGIADEGYQRQTALTVAVRHDRATDSILIAYDH